MLISARADRARAPVTAFAFSRHEDTYDRYAAGLYRQALLTIDDPWMAEQVVSDVLVDECVRPAAASDTDDAGYRLALSAYRRCRELAGGPAWHSRPPARPAGSFPGCIDPGGLNGKERGALGLVLFGGLGCHQVSRELAIPPPDLTALLSAILHKLAATAPCLADP